MPSKVPNSTVAESDLTGNDLGPLAWVLDELRQSLEGAAKALKRFVREAAAARGSDLAALDVSPLRIAHQQLHQSIGALEVVGLPGAAPLLRSMESAIEKFIVQPEHCNQDAVAKIEFASFAVTEYLEGILAGKEVSAVSLFPQYRDVRMLLRADRIHPADLWPMAWRWLEPFLTRLGEPRAYDADARAVLDQAVLQLMKGKAPQAARQLCELSLGFSVNQADKRVRIFWVIAAAYFEALAQNLLPADLYVRRAASRILLQYTALAKGDTSISDRLAQDLVFFCAQAAPGQGDHSALEVVRLAYGLAAFKPVNYELVQFGRFDPALLSQARKRITSAKEGWSSLSAGDTSKFRRVVDQFSLVADSLVKLHPPSEPLAQALVQAIDSTVRSAQAPRTELAMELATCVLYLEAAFEDLDPNDPHLTVRTARLAQRLEAVSAGGERQPLESWMEELYVHDDEKGELKRLMGRSRSTQDLLARESVSAVREAAAKPDADVCIRLDTLGTHSPLAGQPEPAALVSEPAVPDFKKEDLRGIFLEEATAVVGQARRALSDLGAQVDDASRLTVLRRALRTLKGRSRMVGLAGFGDAAWAFERLVNGWLTDQRPASREFLALLSETLAGFACWVSDIAARQHAHWSAEPFRLSAEAMRHGGHYLALNLSGDSSGLNPALSAPVPEPATAVASGFLPLMPEEQASAPQEAEAAALALSDTPAQQGEPDEPDECLLPDDNDDDEQIKVIGGLRVVIPLYNIFLNEADEWSRQLVTEIAEWALEGHQPVSASTVALAHSLADSSAMVGFSALSEMVRALEHALEKSRGHHRHGGLNHGQVFVDASEDIRRLLHQFAAGFLKQPEPGILARLNQLAFPDAILPDPQGMDELEEFNFIGEPDDAPNRPLTLVPATTFAGARLLVFNDEEENKGGIDAVNAVNAIDADLFPIFEEECAELIAQLGGALRQWSSRPDNNSARLEVLRVLHTLKGSARLVGALRLGEMAHRIESEIDFLGPKAAACQEFELLLLRFDRMQTAFERLRPADAKAQTLSAEPLVPLSPVAAAEPFASASSESPPAAKALPLTGESREIVIPAPNTLAMQPLRQAAMASIRVSSQLRDSLNDMNGNLNRLRHQLRDLELQAQSRMQSRLAQSKEAPAGFDPLEFDRFTRMQELTRMMAQSVSDVATVQRTLQRTIRAAEDDLAAQGAPNP